jgi:hypothetical protein
MSGNIISNYLSNLRENIDKEVKVLNRASKVCLASHYLLQISYLVCSITVLSLSSANANLITSDQIQKAYIINICIIVFTALGLLLSGIASLLSLKVKSDNCSLCSKLYQNLSLELQIKINKYNDLPLLEEGYVENKFNNKCMYYTSRIQTIQIIQPLIFYTDVKHEKQQEV